MAEAAATTPAVATSPPAASGLSKYSAQVLGGLNNINWSDLFSRLMGGGQASQTPLASIMVPQLGPVVPPTPPARVAPAKAPMPATPQVGGIPPGWVFNPDTGTFNPTGLQLLNGKAYAPPGWLQPMPLTSGFGVQGYGQGGAQGMDVTGQGAFGDVGYLGVGYGDQY